MVINTKSVVVGATYEEGILRAVIQLESYHQKVPKYRLKILSGAQVITNQGGFSEANQAINAATKFGLTPNDWVIRSQEVPFTEK